MELLATGIKFEKEEREEEKPQPWQQARQSFRSKPFTAPKTGYSSLKLQEEKVPAMMWATEYVM